MRPDASRGDDPIDIDDSGPRVLANAALSNSLTDPETHNKAVLTTCYQLLHAVRTRPPDELQDPLEPLFRGGLIRKVSTGHPYEGATTLPGDDYYALCAGANKPLSSDTFQPTEYEYLPASIVTGPGYDHDESLQVIRERYEVANGALRFTFPRLLPDQARRATVVKLRNDGWLD